MAKVMTSSPTTGTSSMEEVLNDEGVVSIIMSKLLSATDWYAASIVSKGWHDAVIQQTSKLVVRSSASLRHVAKKFKHIRVLDLGHVNEELEDADLELCAESFQDLRSLTIGRESCPSKITNTGILTLAAKCRFLEHLKLVHVLGLEDSGLQALSAECLHLRSLALESCFSLTDAAISAICDFPALVVLEIFGGYQEDYELLTASGLVRIGTRCPNLLRLRLPDALDNMDEVVKAVAKGCPKLQAVSIGYEGVDLDSLVDCKSLTSLSVRSGGYPTDRFDGRGRLYDNKVLSICCANKNLKELLYNEKYVELSDHAVREIMQGLQLEKFCLAAALWLSPATFLSMASCRTLQHLTLERIGSGDKCLAHIGQFSTGLQSLALRKCDGLTSMRLKSIVLLNPHLRLLDLSKCTTIGIKGFSAIAQCKHLQVLDLSSTNVNDGGLVAIAKGVRYLTQLKLNMCTNINNMEMGGSFTTLETLEVRRCGFVSDHWLERLPSRCPRLLHLDVSSTGVSDEGIVHLCRCSLLRTLNTGFCKSVNGPGLIRVAKSCLFLEQVTVRYTPDKSRIVELEEQVCRVSLDYIGSDYQVMRGVRLYRPPRYKFTSSARRPKKL